MRRVLEDLAVVEESERERGLATVAVFDGAKILAHNTHENIKIKNCCIRSTECTISRRLKRQTSFEKTRATTVVVGQAWKL